MQVPPMADGVGSKRRRDDGTDGDGVGAADGEMVAKTVNAVTVLVADGAAVAAGDNASWLAAGEEIRRSGAAALWLNDTECGSGAAFVTNQRVVWLAASGHGFAMAYPAIIVHGVCRDLEAFPHPCIYCQLAGDDVEGDGELVDGDAASAGAAGGRRRLEDGAAAALMASGAREARIVPADGADSLDDWFTAIADCSALHVDGGGDGDGDGEEGEGGGGGGPGSMLGGGADFMRLMAMMAAGAEGFVDTDGDGMEGQFEDADGDGDGEGDEGEGEGED